jgi:hypothetical protein
MGTTAQAEAKKDFNKSGLKDIGAVWRDHPFGGQGIFVPADKMEDFLKAIQPLDKGAEITPSDPTHGNHAGLKKVTDLGISAKPAAPRFSGMKLT